MFKNYNFLSYFWYSSLAAIVFCMMVFIFISKGDYNDTWWMFVGNGLFMIAIFYFIWSFNKTKRKNASASSLVMAGHITTVMGIVLSCIISYILLILHVPGIFESGETTTTVTSAPVGIDTGKTDGLISMVFMSAIVGNIAVGSFVSIIFAYTSKKDQTEDTKEIKYKIPT